jgi:hypothetical protein
MVGFMYTADRQQMQVGEPLTLVRVQNALTPSPLAVATGAAMHMLPAWAHDTNAHRVTAAPLHRSNTTGQLSG